MTETSTTTPCVTFSPDPTWTAYAVLIEDDGLGCNLYETPDQAKHDMLYRGKALIARLNIKVAEVVTTMEPVKEAPDT